MKNKKRLKIGICLFLVVAAGLIITGHIVKEPEITPKTGTYKSADLDKSLDSLMVHYIVLSDSDFKIETRDGIVTLNYIIERKLFGKDVIKLSQTPDSAQSSAKDFDGAEFTILSDEKIQSAEKYSYIDKNEVYILMKDH